MKVTKKILRSSRKINLRQSVSLNNRLYALPVRTTRHTSPNKPPTTQTQSTTPVTKKEAKEKTQEKLKAVSGKAQTNAKQKDTPDVKQATKRERPSSASKNEKVTASSKAASNTSPAVKGTPATPVNRVNVTTRSNTSSLASTIAHNLRSTAASSVSATPKQSKTTSKTTPGQSARKEKPTKMPPVPIKQEQTNVSDDSSAGASPPLKRTRGKDAQTPEKKRAAKEAPEQTSQARPSKQESTKKKDSAQTLKGQAQIGSTQEPVKVKKEKSSRKSEEKPLKLKTIKEERDSADNDEKEEKKAKNRRKASTSSVESKDSAADDSENNMEMQLDDEWIETLMNEYWRVRHQFEESVNTEGVAAFSKARQPLKYQTHNGAYPVPFELHENVARNQQLAFLRNENNAVVQRCSVIPLEHIESTPAMQYWTLTEANAEDEYTLSHIPFLGDAEDDAQFCSELMKTFPDGIHGTKDGCGHYINDWILYYTIKGVKAALPDLELKTIFHCVYEQFPNKASVQNLVTMYPDLQIRFEPHTIEKQELTNRQGELVANFSASRLLNSYEVLVCHKCFCYDCPMHNATLADGYGSTRKYTRPKEHDGRHCSDDCYLNIYNHMKREQKMKAQANAESNGSSSSKDLAKQLNVNVDMSPPRSDNDDSMHSYVNEHQHTADWSPHEEAIFNILRTTGEENYCKITQVLNICSSRKKTCRELYEYACRTAPLSPRLELVPSPVKNGKKKGDTHRTFRAVKWASTNGKVENNCMYKPCTHKGECRKEFGCRCVIVGNLCTKYCDCSDDCQNRFPGCRCAPGNCRTRQCQCYFASWECDPDICKSCNCDKFDGCGEPICKNVSIQRGLQKRLLVAPSQVAGWGCFAMEDIEKNEFVSEYCGEVISQAESERRGKIYDKIKCSYLFGLNDEQVVDATRVGNVIRFANHSRNPNCRAKVIVVNGDHKIGIFANRRIERGEELFFDYAYNKSQQVAFLSKELSRHHNKDRDKEQTKEQVS
ncbi:SET domain-containing protein [Ditylenchus destructor]|nr:SET domain-containing protein [Ditylenchus destructor]